MEIVINTRQILKGLLILAWIIFTGLCIEAGGFIFNAVYTLVKGPVNVAHFWKGADFSSLYNYDHGWYFVVISMPVIGLALRGWLFIIIIRLLSNKNISFNQPFSKDVRRFIFYLSYLSLMIGVFSSISIKNVEGLARRGVQMPDTEYLHLGGADVWLFMAVILFVIAQIFKRGIEIQTENELTI